MADYRYLLGDLLTGDILAELPFTTATYSHVLNAPGAFSGTMGLRQPAALTAALRGAVALGRSTLYVEREGVIVWGGILWTRAVDFQGGSWTLNGEGWHSYFRGRHLTTTKTYAQVEQVSIAADLIEWAQAQPGGNIHVETGTVTPTGVLRDRTYADFERKNIGEALEQLAAVINGFDFRYDTDWQGDVIGINLRTTYPATGRVTDLVFELGVQLSDAKVTVDGTSLVTHVDGIGALDETSGVPLLVSVEDTSRLARMPRRDDVIAVGDVSVPATLTEHADRRLQRGAEAVLIPQVAADPAQEPKIGSWIVGDQVRVRADLGLEQIDGLFRVTEYSVRVGEGGDGEPGEVASLSFANAEVF